MLWSYHIIERGSQVVSFMTTWECLCLTLIGAAILLLRTRYRKDLRDIPGPFWASILPFDRLITSASGQQQWKHIQYHESYGPFVRIGPNHVSISRGEFITQIYGIGNAYPKACHSFNKKYPPLTFFTEQFLLRFRWNLSSGLQISNTFLDPR